MIKKITITFVALIIGVATMAQKESVSKQINRIKRNPLYIYSEATMATEEEAREVACEMLLQQVKEYVESKKYLVKADNILIKDIKTKSESLTMRRGTMYRMFLYVSKTDIESVNNVTNINSSTGTTISTNNVVSKVSKANPSVEQNQKETGTVINSSVGTTISTNKVESKVSNEKPSVEQNQKETGTVINSSVGTTVSTNKVKPKVSNEKTSVEQKQEESETGTRKGNIFSKKKKVEEPTEVKSEPTVAKSELAEVKSEPTVANEKVHANPIKEIETTSIHSDNLPKWQQQVIESLLSCTNLSEIRNKLNRLKLEYKISSFGTADKCRSVANSYWIIFDNDGRVITILGMGETERLDYNSMQTSSLEKYRGMNALWFNFAK